VTLVPGNHDAYADPFAFERALSGPLAPHAFTSRPGTMIALSEAVLVAVSTAIAQSYALAAGSVSEHGFAAMERASALAAASCRVAIVAMHHAPAEASFGVGWIDGLRERARMIATLRAQRNLFVVHGHTHAATSSAIVTGGTPRIFSARAVVDEAAAAVRLYEARFGRLFPLHEEARFERLASAS
jgi:hypothetical protein